MSKEREEIIATQYAASHTIKPVFCVPKLDMIIFRMGILPFPGFRVETY